MGAETRGAGRADTGQVASRSCTSSATRRSASSWPGAPCSPTRCWPRASARCAASSPLPDPATWAGVDVVLISHLHGDHLHLPSLRLLGPDVRIVVPRGAGAWLRRHGFRRVDELSAGESLSDGDLRITGVRAEHSGHRWGPRLTHGPTTESLGHLLEGAGSTVYVSGDTDLFDGMARCSPRAAVDVALLPVWGWGPTLGPGSPRPGRARPRRWRGSGRGSPCRCTGARSPWPASPAARPLGARMRRLLVEPPRRSPPRSPAAAWTPGWSSPSPARRVALGARLGGGVHERATVLADGWTDAELDRLPGALRRGAARVDRARWCPPARSWARPPRSR